MADTAQPASPQDDGPNPFAERLQADPSLGEVSLAERARLNAVEAAYRGTIAGSADLAEFKRALPDQYERITKDLARYETMRGFDGPLEGAVALAGQLGGGMTSPEALITRVPGVNSLVERLVGGVAGRVLGAGAAQATVQGVANPAIQASEIQSGLRKNYSLGENLAAAAGGAVLGGALHGAGEAVGALARSGRAAKVDTDALARARVAEQQAAESRNMAALAAEDPSLRPGGEEGTLRSASTIVPEEINVGAGRTETGIPVTEQDQALSPRADLQNPPQNMQPDMQAAPEAPAMDAPAVVADPEAAAARAAADVPREAPASPQDGAASPQSTVEGVQSAPDSPQSTPAAEPAAPASYSLKRGGLYPDAPAKPFGELDKRVYNIQRDGEDVGSLVVAIRGDTAEIRDIYAPREGSTDARGVLGSRATSNLLRQFLAENPQIRKLTGERVSGARRGGEHGFQGTGDRVEIAIPDRRRTSAVAPSEPAPAVTAATEAFAEQVAPRAAVQTTSSSGKPLSLSQFIARNGGLALDGEARARDLNRVFVPGGGPLARAKGHSVDGFWREALIEHGYLPPDADGMAARNIEKELFDALDREQRGQRQYSAQDRAPEKGGADNQTREIEAQARKIAAAAKKVGIRAGDVDQRTMMDAAEMLWRGDADDPLVALEHAMMSGEAGPGQRQQSQAVDGLQFRMKPGTLSKVQGALDARPETQAARADLGGLLREDGGDVRFRNREPAAAGEPGRPQPPDGVVSAATPVESPAAEPLRSLQQQAQDLADALNVPLRSGRVQGGKEALGQFRNSDEVMRVRNVADFETVAHEAGHALEKRIGEPLSDLIDRHAVELGPLDYDPQRGDAGEGFAEWVRTAMFNPAAGQRQAPAFAQAFRTLMQREAPDLLERLDQAVAAHQAYLAAPTGEKLATMVRKPEDEGVIQSIRRDGLPATVGLYLSRAYEAVFDDKAPVARAVRSMTRAIYAATGERVRLEGGENPENLVRLFARANQAAVQDMREGVRPYHGIAPEGPSMSDALATATGQPGILGRWDAGKVEEFDRYLVARRAEVLYRRVADGTLERRPIALSPEEVRTAVAEAEAANPNFRAGADQIHQFTRQLLRKQYEGGLIDADLYARLMDEEFYVPLYRHMDERPEGLGGGAGGSDGPGTVDTIKRLRGSDRDVIPPTQSLMTQAFLVNRTLQHNDIIKSFVALARQAREAGAEGVGRILEEIPPTQMMGKKFDLAEAVQSAARAAGTSGDDLAVLNGAITDVFGNDPIMATIFRAEPTGKRGEPLVFYKDGGQLRAVRLQARDEGLALYETLSALPPVARDFALKFGATTSSLLRTGIVTNPTFAITNFFRDQLAVGVLRSDYVPFVSGARGVASELRQDQWAQLYAYGGGVSPGAGSAGLSELIDRDVEALARRGWAAQKLGGIGDLAHGHLLGPLKAGAEVVETAEAGTRLSVMKTVFEQKKRQGLSDYDAMIEAAAQATDVLDFGRHGSGTLYLRTLVPFFNAHLQALDLARRTLIDPLWRSARDGIVTEQDAAALKNAGVAWLKLAGVGGALGTMYGLWASQSEAYRDANEELRATHLILPGDAFGRPGKILVVPKPFELAMGFNLGEAVGLKIATGDPRAASFAMDGVREVIQPPNPLTGIPLVKTAAELALNRSFFTGRDIVPDNLQNREHPELEVKPNTTSGARAIGAASRKVADAVSAAGSFATGGLIDEIGKSLAMSPIKVDYAVGSMFGNWGRDLMSVSNQADPNQPAAANEDTMFLRRFIKGADRSSETTKLFWEQAAQRNGAFAQAAAHYGDLLKSYQDRDASDYLAALPAAQRAYVMLSQGGDEDTGKAAFNADDKRLHPITRAASAVQVVGGLIKELTNNSQKTFEDGERIGMDPQKRRDVIDALRVLQAIEQRNAMVLTQQKGYEGRPMLSAEDQFAVLKAQSPVAAAELATRYATNKILPTDTVAKLWPEAQRRLLADGTQAEIRDLALDAKVDGWAFDGDAVRKPQRRRVGIDPSAPPPPRGERRIPPALSVPKDNPVANPFN
ncbi:LPD38 domain-containing protein [Methylobacterium fujisawaense]